MTAGGLDSQGRSLARAGSLGCSGWIDQLSMSRQVLMPGSDVTVVGMVGTECFAIDYYLESRVQCDYASGQVQPLP